MQVRDLARRQLAAGHEVHVITTTPRRPGRPARPTTTAPTASGAPPGVPAAVRAAGQPAGQRRRPPGCCREHEFDVAHVHAGRGVAVRLRGGTGRAPGRRPDRRDAALPVGLPDAGLPARRTSARTGPGGRVVFSAVSDVAAVPLRRIGGPRDARSSVLPNGIDPAEWAVDAAAARPGRRAGRLGHAAGAAQAADAAAADAARGPRPGPVRRRRSAAGHRRGPGAALAGALPAPHRDGRLGRADRPAGPRRDQGDRTSARTCSSRPPTWSRSASPRWRRAAPGCRCWPRRTAASASSSPTSARACSRPTTASWSAGWYGCCARRACGTAIAEHNRTVPPVVTWEDVLPRTEAVYARAAELLKARTLGR